MNLTLMVWKKNSSRNHRLNTVDELKRELVRFIRTIDLSGLDNLAATNLSANRPSSFAYQKAFGYSNFTKKDSLNINHVFYGASLSKAVFGYIVAQLVNEGLIDLDKPIQEYLDVPIPEMDFDREWRGFKNIANDDRYKDITARMCLSHTTGFPNWRWVSRTSEFQPEDKIQFYFDPGTDYSYSGEGIRLL
jgi:CubicO group peptidase (beta-lactamase class C family)